MNQLIFDIDSRPEFTVEESVNESTGKSEKVYKIKGIFSTIGERNRNGRIYPRNLWEDEINKYQQNFYNGSINTLMEWEHPARTTVDPMKAVAKINSLKIEGKYVMGEAVLLNNPQANQLKSLIDNGVKISVSSRGTGSVNNGIVDKFNLITYDIVPNPSDFNATMNGMCESHQLNEGIVQDLFFTIDKNGNIVSADKPEVKEETVDESVVNEVPETKEVYSKEDIAKAFTKRVGDLIDSFVKGRSKKWQLSEQLKEKVMNHEIILEDAYNFEIRYLVRPDGSLNESNFENIDFKRIASSLMSDKSFENLDNIKYIKLDNYNVTEIKTK